jgi:hypothetical protein
VTGQAIARVVVLGASNVARGIATIVDVAREALGGPLDVVAAMGHGRSYGLTTSIPFRTLPGILESGLWQALPNRPPLPTWTVLTDIGNDLIYGCPPEQVTAWIDDAVQRLRSITSQHATQQESTQRLLLTGLPLASLQRLGPARFHAFRSALFPKSRLQLDVGRRYARELDDAVQQLAAQHGAEFFAPRGEWYGFDPIHIGVRVQRVAWREIFFTLTKKIFSPASALHSSWREWRRMMLVRPEQSTVFFRARRVAQPAVVLSDGTTISFY